MNSCLASKRHFSFYLGSFVWQEFHILPSLILSEWNVLSKKEREKTLSFWRIEMRITNRYRSKQFRRMLFFCCTLMTLRNESPIAVLVIYFLLIIPYIHLVFSKSHWAVRSYVHLHRSHNHKFRPCYRRMMAFKV